jgi:hypothetical protein
MLTAALLFTVLSAAPAADAAPVVSSYIPQPATEAELISDIAAAVKVLAAALPPEELKQGTFTYNGKEHRYWHFVPTPLLKDETLGKTYAPYGRFGVPVEKMSDEAIDKLHRLLRTALSTEGYRKIQQGLLSEDVSNLRTGVHGLGRSPTSKPAGGLGYYFFTVFGAIGEGDWGWRFEGHHMSVGMEFTGGHIKVTPVFFGYNPSPVLPKVNEVAARFFHLLSPEQQKEAQIVTEAGDKRIPADVERAPDITQQVGTLLTNLSPEAQFAFDEVVEEYIGAFPEALVGELRRQVHAQTAQTRFAWYGAFDQTKPYFFKVQGPAILIQMKHQGLENGHLHGHANFQRLDGR